MPVGMGGLLIGIGGASSSFSPTQIAGLVVWIRADKGITQSGGSVSAWADQSGNGNNFSQGTSANQPTTNASSINGQAGITFAPGSSTFMSASASTGFDLSAYTIYAVVKTGSSVPSFSAILSNATTYSWNDGWGIINPSASAGSLGAFSGSYLTAGSGSASANTAYCIRAEFNGSAVNVWLNGSAQTAGTGSEIDSSAALSIGAQLTSGAYTAGSGFLGDIDEILVFNSVLSGTNLSNMATYISGRYGLSA